MPARVRDWCRRVSEAPRFHNGVLALIVLNAAAMGVETEPAVVARHGWWLGALTAVMQGAFVVEIAIRLAASRPLAAFFRDGWNLFDFAVVGLSLLPVSGPFATVARLARVLRVARLVSVSAELRLIVATMLRSIPSMGHVVLLLGILLYVYAILGVHLFRDVDPTHWGTLGLALLSLFQVITLEGWPEMQAAVIGARPLAWIYFASFVVIAVFVVINLFIAVVINNLQAVQEEERLGGLSGEGRALATQAAALRQQLQQFERQLQERGDRALPPSVA